MKQLNALLLPTCTVLLIIIIVAGLTNNDRFYNPADFAYYSFCATTFIFVITTVFLDSTKNNTFNIKIPLLLFGLWCFYIAIHYFINKGTLNFTVYSLALYFLLIASTTLFSSPNFNFKLFFISIAIIALLESIYCVSQFLGWFKSQNKLFSVTGSWNNPNVTAIFLALTTPIFLFLFRGKRKKIVLASYILLLIALLLLKCRAALIGTVLSTVVYYSLEYQLIFWVKNKKNKTSFKALLILALLIIIPIGSHLYNGKKASADGRKFIWRLSAQMSTQKPLTGYGYGNFEKEYNLYQANYIQNGKANSEELGNAGPVIMPHNELLLNMVEGGSIGLLLILLFFGSLLLAIKKQDIENKNVLNSKTIMRSDNSIFNLSYAGIVAFIGISMVNSTFQIIPLMSCLIIYAAIISSTLEPLQLPSYLLFLERTKFIPFLIKAVITSMAIYLLFLTIGLAKADNLNKRVALLKKEKKYEQALQIMPDLAKKINNYPNYWKNYANIYVELREYSKALDCFEKAQKWSSLPELYMGSGFCNEKLNQYPQAIKDYETLVALYPSKFSYRMFLLTAYLKNGNIDKAIVLAQEIIEIKPKVSSEKVDQYKNICYGLLKQLIIQKNNKQLILKNSIH